jgi:hydroxymethylbilane synthase
MLVIGSRGSQLALWQAKWIEARLAARGHETRIEIIKTTGDKIADVPLAQVGVKGLFTKEIEEALLAGRIDVAVHSLKDLPTEVPAGLAIAAVPEREDARDAVVGARLSDLPAGAKVGTSSLRRAAQLRIVRRDLAIEDVRGNLDTRVHKLDEGRYRAIVLAAAGLARLGWSHRIAEILSPEVMCPAAGQGALAVETRAEGEAREICAALDHAATRAAITAERAALAVLGGGCQVPIGAYGQIDRDSLRLIGAVIAPGGERSVKKSGEGAVTDAAEIGRRLGEALLLDGARDILEQTHGTPERDCAV